MPSGPAPTVGTGNSVTAPDVVIRPILLPAFSQNHSVPSAVGVIPIGRLFGVGVSNSMKLPIAGIHSADLGCPAFAEPELPVRTEHDDVRLALRRRNRMQNDLNVSHRALSLYCRRGE